MALQYGAKDYCEGQWDGRIVAVQLGLSVTLAMGGTMNITVPLFLMGA